MDADGPKSRMQIEDQYDRRLKDILREMVIDRQMSVAQIVAELGMTEPHVRHWLKHYDLYRVLYDLCPCCGHVIRKSQRRSS